MSSPPSLGGNLQRGQPCAPSQRAAGPHHPLFKERGADRPCLALKLLLPHPAKTEYKLTARAVASRKGPLLTGVVDATKVACLPNQ